MKFTVVIAFLAAAASVTANAMFETNGHRLARGLPPKAPLRRATPVSRARRGQPSGTPPSSSGGQCNTGPQQCCNTVQQANSADASSILSVLGLLGSVPATAMVGLDCSPISAVGVGSGSSCSQQPVCCGDNTYNGLINIGCTPITL